MSLRLGRIHALAALAIAGGAGIAPRLVAGKEKGSSRGDELRNVEVLPETMRVAEARRFMLTFNDALGVQCRDCHDLRDFASDAKEMKLEARRMMKMQKGINDAWFAGQEKVTCFTCHAGKTTPAIAPLAGTALTDSAADAAARPDAE